MNTDRIYEKMDSINILCSASFYVPKYERYYIGWNAVHFSKSPPFGVLYRKNGTKCTKIDSIGKITKKMQSNWKLRHVQAYFSVEWRLVRMYTKL